MSRLLFGAALVLLAAVGAVAQEGGARRPDAASFALLEDVSAEAARLLASRGNVGRAWGAYLAGAYDLKEHAPLLVALLEDADAAVNVNAAAGGEEAAVRRAALDALIRLDAEVPAEKLLPLYQLAPDETIILLARAPERNAGALLTLFAEETPGALWVAVGNLLTEARAKGFAARLLAGLEIRARVYVYDSRAERGYSGGYGNGCGGSRHFGLPLDGFPPSGRYTLTATPTRGAAVVAHGRHTVYYVRTGAERGYMTDPDCGVERDAYRVEYLTDLLRTTGDDLGLEARPSHGVVCRDARECRRELAALRDEVGRAYSEVLARLAGAELLDASEASALKPDLTFILYDHRDRKTSPLPEKLEGVQVESAGGAANAGEAGGSPPPAARP